MLTLTGRVADPLTGDTELGVDTDEIEPAVDDLSTGDRHIQPSQPGWSPASQKGSKSNLGDGLERQHLQTAGQERLLPQRKRRVRHEPGAVDVGVDHHRTARHRRGQLRTAARKAWASSSSRTSITISP